MKRIRIDGSILQYIGDKYDIEDYPIVIVGLYTDKYIEGQHVVILFITDSNTVYGVTCSSKKSYKKAILTLKPEMFKALSKYNLVNDVDVIFEEFTKQVMNLRSFESTSTQYIRAIESLNCISCKNSAVFLNVDDIPRKYITPIFKKITR